MSYKHVKFIMRFDVWPYSLWTFGYLMLTLKAVVTSQGIKER